MEGVTDPDLLKDRIFFKLGEFTYDRRKIVIILGMLVCILLSSLIALGPDWAESWGEGELESIEAIDLKDSAFAVEDGSQSFVLLVWHDELNDTNQEWQDEIKSALKEFADEDDVTIEYSWEKSGDERNNFVKDVDGKFWARNVVNINLERKEAKALYADLKDTIEVSEGFEIFRTGEIAIDVTFDTRIQEDLISAEIISGPLSLLILLIVFGTVVAALLPIGIAVLTVLSAMGITIWLSNVSDVTQYAVNIITLIGIGVSIDYSLFIVNRFREEIGRGRDIRTATAMTVATSGKAVFFSGITVAIGLMGMLFFENTGLPSLGIGGTLAVSVAMLFSVIVLPSILAVMGPTINKGKVPFSFGVDDNTEDGIWAKIAKTVMDKPWAVLIPTLIILLGAGMPFLQAEFSIASRDALPPDDETRRGLENIDELWPESATNSALIVFDFDGEDPLTEHNIRAMYQWMNNRINDEIVLEGFGYGLPMPGMSEDAVVDFWTNDSQPQEILATREYLREQFISNNISYAVLSLDGPITGEEGRYYVEDLREDRSNILADFKMGSDGTFLIAGFAAYNLDVLNAVVENLPIALAFILISTLILIYIQVRSVIIPIKAIVMNILSISASFGMLVFVFQWGYGSELLNFTPQPIEATNPVIMFCIVFGLSMDYEVLMLSRIHEEWERTGDNTLAVANGLQRTGRLITGAAAIMVVVFFAFGLSSIVILKQIGLGLALAIFLDATIVRALVVPSTMRLMGKWNWWSPKWLSSTSNDFEDVKKSEE